MVEQLKALPAVIEGVVFDTNAVVCNTTCMTSHTHRMSLEDDPTCTRCGIALSIERKHQDDLSFRPHAYAWGYGRKGRG